MFHTKIVAVNNVNDLRRYLIGHILVQRNRRYSTYKILLKSMRGQIWNSPFDFFFFCFWQINWQL